MAEKIKALPDVLADVKFNTKALEQFANQRGILFEHYAALPSPIGLKDRGDYRRSDSLDTISSNGFIYKKVGEFKATIVGNNKIHQDSDGGIYDNSTARIILPKYYLDTCGQNDKEIALLPGDRIYAKECEVLVPNYQRAEYRPDRVDMMQFPVKSVAFLIDSKNTEYKQGRQFTITADGNIKWINGRKNPGIDPETGKGAVYSIRYKYLAFWYIERLVNEIRITTDENDNPVRLPYHAVIQREYIYHNKQNGDKIDTNTITKDSRTNEAPIERLDVDNFDIQVDVKNFK